MSITVFNTSLSLLMSSVINAFIYSVVNSSLENVIKNSKYSGLLFIISNTSKKFFRSFIVALLHISSSFFFIFF